MTIQEADKLFKDWQEYQEINDKLVKFFMFSGIPKSFLPYPEEVLEEALNMVAKSYFDAGDHKTSKNIQETIASLLFYKEDEEVFEEMTNSAIRKDPKIKEALLNNLRESRDSWAKFKKRT